MEKKKVEFEAICTSRPCVGDERAREKIVIPIDNFCPHCGSAAFYRKKLDHVAFKGRKTIHHREEETRNRRIHSVSINDNYG